MAIDKKHYLHSKNGRLSDATDHSPLDVSEIVANVASSGERRLIIHFHGGLVSKSEGLKIAETLSPIYQTGGYPIFFIWESAVSETIKNNACEIANEPIFQGLIRKAIEYALNAIGYAEGARSIQSGRVRQIEVKTRVDAWFADPSSQSPPFSDVIVALSTDTRAVDTDIDDNQIQMDLESDTDFFIAVSDLADTNRNSYEHEAGRTKKTLMDDRALDSIAPREGGIRGGVSMVNVAIIVAKTVRNIVRRIRTGRDHGFYVTVVEEVLRSFYLDTIGKTFLWNQMKKDTADAFGADPHCAGTALLAAIKNAMRDGLELDRIFLVGHSTGGIYISNFLDAVESMKFDQKLTFDIVLLAPANTHRAFAKTIDDYAGRIRWLRLFGMQDAIERCDGLLGDDWRRAFYPSSLLYLVSALLEDEVDEPIVGMQRFIAESHIFSTSNGHAASDKVREWLCNTQDRLVWSLANEKDGRCTSARKHGAFDNDADTLQSLAWIISN